MASLCGNASMESPPFFPRPRASCASDVKSEIGRTAIAREPVVRSAAGSGGSRHGDGLDGDVIRRDRTEGRKEGRKEGDGRTPPVRPSPEDRGFEFATHGPGRPCFDP
jgi:hypothetical protein